MCISVRSRLFVVVRLAPSPSRNPAWTALDHFRQGILAWVIADHSAETFKPLWNIVCQRQVLLLSD